MLVPAPVATMAPAAAEPMLVPASPSAAATTTAGSGAGVGIGTASKQHKTPALDPARRVLRALLWPARQVERQRQIGRAAATSSSASSSSAARQHHQRQQQQHRPGGATAAPERSLESPPPPQQQQQPQQPQHQQHLVTLHSAASLPPPTPPEPSSPSAAGPRRSRRQHHHHRRRQDSAAAVIAAAPAPTAAAAAAGPPPASPPLPPPPAAARAWAPLRSLLRLLLHHSHRAARNARPHGPGCNDLTPLERTINVATSLPFLAVGLRLLRTRRAPASRRFGRSFVAVGAIAGAYHACPRGGPVRDALRKLDYYSIAWSSSILREAVFGGRKLPSWLALAACVATPLKPTLVTGANLAAIEVRYAQAAWSQGGHVRASWARHVGVAAAGLACFLVEDEAAALGAAAGAAGKTGRAAAVPFNAFHGVWHLLSAAALGLVNVLLGHVEEAFLLEAAEAVGREGALAK